MLFCHSEFCLFCLIQSGPQAKAISTYYQFLMMGKRESLQLSIFTMVSNDNIIKGGRQHGVFTMGQTLFHKLYLHL